MIPATQLTIRLTPGPSRPPLGVTTLNQLQGGPETLLGWLETQLGLPTPNMPRSSCVTEYAAALDGVTDSVISRSLQTDRWETASELLARRDELLLAGWDGSDSGFLPEIVRDLARAAAGRTFAFPCVAERLQRVLAALEAGQRLPAHRCLLLDSPEEFPRCWQNMLAKLTTEPAGEPHPAAHQETALYRVQTAILGGDVGRTVPDPSFRCVYTLSQTAAIEAVAAALAADPAGLSRTVIVCEDDQLAVQLDACLDRLGLPTMGASACSRAHPVLQVLPLALALCREPVDPQQLLDFLTLPVSPVPRRAAAALAEALAEQPGLGSGRWEAAMEELCLPENDPDGTLRRRLDSWLFCDRIPPGEPYPSRLVRARCAAVAQWASSRAAALLKQPGPDHLLIHALQAAAGQASLLGELAESQGQSLTEPQLARLLEEAQGGGAEMAGFPVAAGGPMRARSLAGVDRPCHRVIWLGLGTADEAPPRWSAVQIEAMKESGIELDDGSRALTALRSAEARGMCCVEDALLAVMLPQDADRRWHPIWLAICNLLPAEYSEQPLILEKLITAGDVTPLAPFDFPLQSVAIRASHRARPHWDLPAGLIRDRETVSAAELQDRLGCPLKWVLNYQAQLRPGPVGRLPDDFQLKGSFCHSVLEQVFGQGGELPTIESATAQIREVFDRRLPLDAAPLARPHRELERQKLRNELEKAARVLLETLAGGGYTISGFEVELSGEAFGKSLMGRIDCVAVRADGQEAVIDFKYGGRSKYRSLLEDGRAVQLATYARGRATPESGFPAAAYLVLSDGMVFTPSGSPVHGVRNGHIDGNSMQDVWKAFASAIQQADDWLTGEVTVPARPLQIPDDWPDGVELVLETKLKSGEQQPVCGYCHYQPICGLRELA